MPDPHGDARKQHASTLAASLAVVYGDARADVLARVAATGDVLNVLRAIWRVAVRREVGGSMKATAADVGKEAEAFDPSTTDRYLEVVAENFAARWEESTREALDALAGEMDATFDQLQVEAKRIMDEIVASATVDADDLTGTAANLAAFESAEAEGKTSKTWHTSSTDSRSSHAALNGTTIPMGEVFANGLRFPKAPGPPQETVNCECYLTFGG